MKCINLSAAIICAAMLSATSAWAQSGSEGVFTIHNDTESNTLISFYTNDGSGWSANWLSEDLDPGTAASAEFTAETGSCAQTFKAGWLGENGSEVMDEPHSIDVCEASNVYLGDNEISFD